MFPSTLLILSRGIPMMQLQVICGVLEAGGHTDVSEGKIQCSSFAYQAWPEVLSREGNCLAVDDVTVVFYRGAMNHRANRIQLVPPLSVKVVLSGGARCPEHKQIQHSRTVYRFYSTWNNLPLRATMWKCSSPGLVWLAHVCLSCEGLTC